VTPSPQGLRQLLLEQLLDEAAGPLPQPASPANMAAPAGSLVLSSFMVWFPPACHRRSWLGERAGDYAASNSNHFRDGTGSICRLSALVTRHPYEGAGGGLLPGQVAG